jgi:putative ABC transport system permease protein
VINYEAIMRVLETVRISLRALERHRLRSFLTTLGIIIGVFAVITIVAVGEGAQKMVSDQIKSLGANRIMLSPGVRGYSGAHDPASTSCLTLDDAKAIAAECPSVAFISPTARTSAMVVAGNQNWQTSIQGSGADFPRVRDWMTARGSFFTEIDVSHANKVCLIGKTVADRLFPDHEDPVGKVVRIKAVPFRVIGVLTPKGQAAWGQDQDDVVIPPYTTVMKKLTGATYLNQIQLSARSEHVIDSAEEEITTLLRRRHRIPAGEEADFNLRSQKEVQQAMEQTYGTIVGFLMSVASISLLVGGIGIMNIMLVSVTERIREIGIRMAVGAQGRDILAQFLLEAVILALLGGLLGVLLGVGSAHIISQTLRWPILINRASAVVAFLFSGLVGVIFGFFPAWRASRLDPIQALKQD